jgi:hypothetical protein
VNRLARIPAPLLVAGAVVLAIVVNVGIHALGRAAGATYRFTAATGPAEVDPLTVLGFTLLPLGIALTLVAVLGRFWRWVFPVALVAGPVLELGSILGMTVPADFDLASKIALASCHLVLVPVSVLAVLALRRRTQLSESREFVDVSSTKVALSGS